MNNWTPARGDEFRPTPPSDFDSLRDESQLSESTLRVNSESQLNAARAAGDGRTFAQALALTGIAIADAEVTARDGKYAYRTARPITIDPDLDMFFPTPPFPGYLFAHVAVSNAAAVAPAHVFLDEE